MILGIDTSTSALAVAVGAPSTLSAAGAPSALAEPAGGGVSVRGRAQRIDARGHSEHLAPLIAGLLDDLGLTPNDLTGIVVGNGPGPFTGLRVGIATGLVMGAALGIEVRGVCSLDVLAAQAVADGVVPEGAEFLVASDARRKEVYWGRYAVRSGAAVRLAGPGVERPEDLAQELRALPTVGRGALLHPQALPRRVGEILDVDAGTLLEVAAARWGAGQPLPVEPLYLRRPDALTLAERGQG